MELLDAAETGSGEARAGILDTLALCLFESGEKSEAIRVQKEALAMPISEGLKRELQGRLAEFEK